MRRVPSDENAMTLRDNERFLYEAGFSRKEAELLSRGGSSVLVELRHASACGEIEGGGAGLARMLGAVQPARAGYKPQLRTGSGSSTRPRRARLRY